MHIRPLQDRILIERLASDEMTKGGIVIPNSAQEKPMEGKVIAVGKGKADSDGKTQALEVKPGDHILFGKYAGTEIKVGGQEQVILREEDILGILEN